MSSSDPTPSTAEFLRDSIRRVTPGGPVDMSSRKVGAYRVLHTLGRGGMSIVYLAFHERLQRHAALKFLHQHLADDATHLKRFMQEAQAAAKLTHPNIVQIYDIAEEGDGQYIAQEYVPGTNLRKYIETRGTLKITEVVSILKQVTAALVRSHQAGIVHRDIKPDNILLTASGDVKVADFGLSLAFQNDQKLTEVGVTLGTPTYMSPEQIQGQSVDIRADLYALGVTAFHMLAGRPPFTGDTALAIAMQHVGNRPADLRTIRPDIPPALATLIARLLEKRPDDRPTTPLEVQEALNHLSGTAAQVVFPLAVEPIAEVATVGEHTMQLQSVMLQRLSVSRSASRERRTKLAAPIAIVLVAILGSIAAASLAASRPLHQPLPDPTPRELGIERRYTLEGQYALALLQDSPAYWRAIEQYFPSSGATADPLIQKSWLRLAWLSIAAGDYSAAEAGLAKLRSQIINDPILSTLVSATVYRLAVQQGLSKAMINDALTRVTQKYQTLTSEQQRTVDSILDDQLRMQISDPST